MKNIIIFIGLLLSFFASSAQISTWNSVDIRDHFRLQGTTVSNISADTTFASANNLTLPTSLAVKTYVDNRASSGTIDSLDVSKLKGDTIDRTHLPVFVTKLSNEGGGIGLLYGTNSDTIHASSLKPGANISIVKNSDSSVTISANSSVLYIPQVLTAGSSVTIADNTTWLIINPATTLPSLTVTLPANPTDGKTIDINFGGTINTAAATVVTSFLLVANTGQQLVGTGTYGEVVTEDHICYRFNYSLSKWFRN